MSGAGRRGGAAGRPQQRRNEPEDAYRPPKVNLQQVQQLVEESASAKERRKARIDRMVALGARPTAQQRGNIPLKMLKGLRQAREKREKRRAEEARAAGLVLPSSSSSSKKRKRDAGGPSKWASLRGDRAGISGTVADPSARRALKGHIGRYHEGVVTIPRHQIESTKRRKLN